MESEHHKAPASTHDRETQFVAAMTDVQLSLQIYVRSLMPGDSLAGDVAQQANAKIWEKRSEFEPGTNFKAWALSIARYQVLTYRKQQARDARLTFSEELESTITAELSQGNENIQQRLEALRGCLEKLRSADRELLLHRYSASGTLADYAEKIGRSVGGLKVTLHRLRDALLKCIELNLNQGEVQT